MPANLGSLPPQVANLIGNGDFLALVNALQQYLRPPLTTPTVATTYPGSGNPYTNNSNYTQQVIISGGTVTVISLSAGGTTGETNGTYILRPGDSVTCTSSVNPTVFNVTNLF